MPRCPNCGRETARTEDWACQWCGYPLLSRGYKKIDKTYQQLQEERLYEQELVREETGPSLESEPMPVLEPEAESVPEAKEELEVEPEPEAEAEVKPEPEPAEPEPEIEARPAPEPVLEPERELPPAPEPEPVPHSEPAPKPKPAPEPERLAPKPEPELKPEPPPQPVPVPELAPEPATGIIAATVDELNSAFNADKVTTNARLTGKTLAITGAVDKIVVREHLDIQYILLTSPTKGQWNVRCTFDKQHALQLKRLTERDMVTIQGQYGGYERNIIMRDCAVIS